MGFRTSILQRLSQVIPGSAFSYTSAEDYFEKCLGLIGLFRQDGGVVNQDVRSQLGGLRRRTLAEAGNLNGQQMDQLLLPWQDWCDEVRNRRGSSLSLAGISSDVVHQSSVATSHGTFQKTHRVLQGATFAEGSATGRFTWITRDKLSQIIWLVVIATLNLKPKPPKALALQT